MKFWIFLGSANDDIKHLISQYCHIPALAFTCVACRGTFSKNLHRFVFERIFPKRPVLEDRGGNDDDEQIYGDMDEGFGSENNFDGGYEPTDAVLEERSPSHSSYPPFSRTPSPVSARGFSPDILWHMKCANGGDTP